MDASTPERSSQDHYNKLSRTIDSDIQKALSRSSSSGWLDLVVNHRHRVLARRIVEGLDWSWALNTPQNAAEYLDLYQLFLLCKFVAEDFKPSPSTNRLQLSPSPMIDRLWHAHMLHPGKYLEMHTKLGFGASGKMFSCLLEHQPEAANDSYEEKTKRMASLMGMMFYICPTLYIYSQQSSVAPSAYPDIPKRRTEENAAIDGLTVKVRHKSASVPYIFNVGLNTSLMKIVKWMSSQLSIPESRLRLLYHGVQINPSSTVQSLGMNDGNDFYLFEEQSGC